MCLEYIGWSDRFSPLRLDKDHREWLLTWDSQHRVLGHYWEVSTLVLLRLKNVTSVGASSLLHSTRNVVLHFSFILLFQCFDGAFANQRFELPFAPFTSVVDLYGFRSGLGIPQWHPIKLFAGDNSLFEDQCVGKILCIRHAAARVWYIIAALSSIFLVFSFFVWCS